ncbi:MAG TPA: TonB-dependent receptor, partial [Chitinophagales bacterium]|nr:TonB-dependent receptor [Chitinophagales bacterium]
VLNREQGTPSVDDSQVDSLSPDFSRSNLWVQTGIALKHASKKTQWRLSLAARGISLQSVLNGDADERQEEIYFTPQFLIEKEIKQGEHLRFLYESTVNAPNANQLLPVTNSINPLELFTGNRDLQPEYAHNVSLHWMLFDQFSFTSLFTNLNAGYTKDKINYSKTINSDLTQSLTLVNVSADYRASAGIDFSTPVRFIGLNLHAGVEENYNRGINYVNQVANTINAFTHQFSLSFDNRKKEKIEIDFGGQVELSNATYSVQSEMNNRYFNWSYFLEMHYTPSQYWRFSFNADVNHYGFVDFDGTTYIPLLQAEVVRYILKSNRGVISLKGFDLLNKNSGVTQTSAFNYLQEQQSNTIGRYVMLSFKYRLNKFDTGNSGVDIKVNGR